MRPIRRVIRELFGGVCQHREKYHVQLLLSGTVDEDRDGRRVYCVLNMFINGKKFLCKDVVDELYCRFLERWSGCSIYVKSVVRELCQRESMTRHVFIVLSYFYAVRCMERVARNISCLYLRVGMGTRLECAFRKYARQKIDALMDNVTFQGLTDLHQFAFSFPFSVPIPNQASSPCVTFLRAREYETGCDLPVYHRRNVYRVPSGNAQVSALVTALRGRCHEIPCGNPLFVMAKVFIERYCRKMRRFLIPLGGKTLRCAVRCFNKSQDGGDSSGQWMQSKLATFATSVVLRNGLISSLINLPVWCYCKTKCYKYMEDGVLEAILCDNCGHCLNMGKDKLEGNHNFALNCIFYYRDRQEKSVIYSTHNDTAHCSLCGNQYLSRERIYELTFANLLGVRVATVRWRAVIGSNAACGVFGPGTRLDVLVPCSARTCFETVVLRNLSIDKLMRIVSHSGEFLCATCQSTFRETCLDQDQPSICSGCMVYSRFCCTEIRKRYVD
uniref:Protein UL49 n=1 Tax=Mastomys natalensis cytomegalovirus 1 TaxID=2973541 RepID=A0A9Y1IQF5_9BETA|nr:protein UL49 [Mastomys natalensis cytomegalovirus 1]WEG68917.1 protein UL49 [Mastomys natalensis cytomegalovirus 1]WEG71145.1 protein UL49 [Mastomys natalensis cytomegalovirus 1]